MEWGLDGLEFLLEASESQELRECPEARMFRSIRRRCPRFCLLEVPGGSGLDFVACELQQGDQSFIYQDR